MTHGKRFLPHSIRGSFNETLVDRVLEGRTEPEIGPGIVWAKSSLFYLPDYDIKKYTLKKCLVRSSWEDEFIVNMVQVCLILAARPSQYDAILSKPILCWKTSAFYFGMIRELMWRKTNKWLFLTSEKGDMLNFCSLMSYLIFVTDSRTVSVEKKSVMWRNFKFMYMTDEEKSKISPHVD